jgi:hypothetical protein
MQAPACPNPVPAAGNAVLTTSAIPASPCAAARPPVTEINSATSGLRRQLREHPRRITVNTPQWRWRESNPRPPSLQQGFSGRSVCCPYSAPPVIHTSRCDGPSRCELSRPLPRPARTVSHLADARIRAGDEPGLTDPLRYLGSESEIGATVVGAYFVCVASFTRAATRTSARFPCLDVRSRDHSPPGW